MSPNPIIVMIRPWCAAVTLVEGVPGLKHDVSVPEAILLYAAPG
jgi:hypothetical protein